MKRRPSALSRYVTQLEDEAKQEARLAMREFAPEPNSPAEHYTAAGTAGAMTLMVYARRILHVEQGVGL